MSAAQTTLGVALLVWGYMSAWFVLSLVVRRNDLADVAWGPGFALIGWWLVATEHGSARSTLIAVLVSVWALRLAYHIGRRAARSGEDARYARWRQEWGRLFVVRTYLQVFMLQGLFMLLIAFPIISAAIGGGGPIGPLDVVGTLVWLVGLVFESVGDAQLRRFKRDPANKGRIMQSGLWAYTRHPNYFGEVLVWWGVWLIALSSAYGFLSVVGPITITVLLLGVSGIPLLERAHAGEPEFEAYRARVSAFFPLPPREKPSRR